MKLKTATELYEELRKLDRAALADRAGIHEKGWGRQQLISVIIRKEAYDEKQ